MIKINEDFEADWDGNCWLLYESYDGFKVHEGIKTPCRKKYNPRYYSDISDMCRSVINRSAGIACTRSESIVKAVENAERSLKHAFRNEYWFMFE